MDFKVVGLLDIIFILIGIVVIVFGYKKGFMTKMVRMIASFLIVAISLMLSGHLALTMKKIELIYPGIYDNYYGKMEKSLAEASEGDKTYTVVKRALGCPKFLAKYISHNVGVNDMTKICDETADYIALSITKLIAFFIILVLLFLALLVIIIVIKKLRENQAVRIIDGILGILLYFAIYIAIISLFIFVLKFGIDHDWIKGKAYDFIAKDLQLNTNKFRLMKFLYQENFIKDIYNFLV
ncbi:MAG: hypothetical protein K6E20_05050 [Acholeplasmatales bacterium]|nr:hypothetical protein [Acholeplasmatales bacterium]